jgi:Uncharacterised nucleotidyltransferase
MFARSLYRDPSRGAVAQLGEHKAGSLGVRGSNPLSSTKLPIDDAKQLLCDCLHQDGGRISGERLASVTPETWPSLLAIASVQRVTALLYHRLVSRGWATAVPPATLAQAQRACRDTAAANLRLYEELATVAAAFRASDIAMLVLKGPHVASAVYGDPAIRQMGDLDLLVRARDLERAAEIVTAHGYASQAPYRVATILRTAHQLPALVKPQAKIELHWNIVPPGLACEVDPDELWERATPACIPGIDVLGLAPEDMLLHLCLHTSYQHLFGFGLQPSCDIAETIRRYRDTLDWARLTRSARRWKAERGVYLSLRLAAVLVGAAVPEAVLEDLRPAAFDETTLAEAVAQIFEGTEVSVMIPRHLAQGWAGAGVTAWLGGFAIFLRRLFVSPRELASLYHVAHGSPRVYLYYPARLKALVSTRWGIVRALRRGDPQVVTTARRKAHLASWLGTGE